MPELKRELVREYREKGYSYGRIGEICGVSRTTVWRWDRGGDAAPAIKRKTEEKCSRSGGPEPGDGRGEAAQTASGPDHETLRSFCRRLLRQAESMLDRDGNLTPRDLKCLSGVLLEVKTVLGILPPREEREKELQLLDLKRRAEEEQRDQTLVVRFEDTEDAAR